MSDAPTDPAVPHPEDPDHVVVEGGEPVHLADRPVLVVDFGAQYAQLIARRVREASCFSEIVPHSMPVAEMLAKDPAAVILSGGPSSVYEEGAPSLDPALFRPACRCSGCATASRRWRRRSVARSRRPGLSEFGATPAQVLDTASTLFNGQPADQSVWMSHGDAVSAAPAGIKVTATTSGAPVAAFEDDERRLFGVQWHPEVMHSTFGQQVLENFLIRGAGLVGRVDRRQRRRGPGRRASARRSATPG